MELSNFSEDFKKIYNNALNSLSTYNRTILTSDILLVEMFKTFGTTTKYILQEYEVKLEELLEEVGKFIVINKEEKGTSELLEEIFNFCKKKNYEDSKIEKIDESDIFLAFLKYKSCLANALLENIGINTEESYFDILEMFNLEDFYETYKTSKKENEHTFTTNITELTKANKTNPFFGRIEYIERLNEVLNRKNKNNPLLIGSAGVGKSSLIDGLAKHYLENDETKKIEILSLNLAGILAGSKYRGDFEKKLQDVIDLIEGNKNYILFIDEIHNIISAGSSEGSLDCANILKPVLTKGNVKVIGATTLDEYYKYFEKDKALSRRFQNIFVEEPSTLEVKDILMSIKSKYEEYHHINISDEMIIYLINEANYKIRNRKFPDKAIDILDECLTINKLRKKEEITHIEIDEAIKKIIGVNKDTIYNKFHFKELQNFHTIYSLNINIERNNICNINYSGNKEGLELLIRDISSNFNITNEMTLNLNLNNYNEPFSVSSLIGSPQGYIGYDEGGILYEHIIKFPISLIVFKNYQNACPEVQNLIKNLTANKEVIDRKNRRITTNNCIFITENAKLAHKKLGFNSSEKPIKTDHSGYDIILNYHEKSADKISYKSSIIEKLKIKGYNLIINDDINEENLQEILKCINTILEQDKGSYEINLNNNKKYIFNKEKITA